MARPKLGELWHTRESCPLSREHLLLEIRMHEDVFDRSIDVQILRLRPPATNPTHARRRDFSRPAVTRARGGPSGVFAVLLDCEPQPPSSSLARA